MEGTNHCAPPVIALAMNGFLLALGSLALVGFLPVHGSLVLGGVLGDLDSLL